MGQDAADRASVILPPAWLRDLLRAPAAVAVLSAGVLYMSGALYYLGWDLYLSFPVGAIDRTVEAQLLLGFMGSVPLVLTFGAAWYATTQFEGGWWRRFVSYAPFLLIGLMMIGFVYLYAPPQVTFPFTGTLLSARTVFIAFFVGVVLVVAWQAYRDKEDLFTFSVALTA